mmetsp:Transcript_8406/g.25449  ORF Transcript_8406/g.25449 Transcript_8406/m.25449 type:complete len:243 (-) Transcript_8406:1463-2191(-)
MTSTGSPPLITSTRTPLPVNRCFRSCIDCSSFWRNSAAAVAACWHSSAASAASSESPDSMATLAASAAAAAADAAFEAASAAAMAAALSPCRRRTLVGLRPFPSQKASTSTPGGRFGSSLLRGRSGRSVASMTRIRSTPAGSWLPYVASHLRPLRRPMTVSSLESPLPVLGKVATHASTCSYQGIIGFLFRLSCQSSSSNSMLKKSSISVSKSSTSSSSSDAQMDSGGGASAYVPKSRKDRL